MPNDGEDWQPLWPFSVYLCRWLWFCRSLASLQREREEGRQGGLFFDTKIKSTVCPEQMKIEVCVALPCLSNLSLFCCF